jgi:hypothetical protein
VHEHAVHVATGEHPEDVPRTRRIETRSGPAALEEPLDAIALQIQPQLLELELQLAQLWGERSGVHQQAELGALSLVDGPRHLRGAGDRVNGIGGMGQDFDGFRVARSEERPPHQLPKYPRLGLEGCIDGRDRDPGACRDLGDGRGIDPFPGEELPCCRKDSDPRCLGALGAALA